MDQLRVGGEPLDRLSHATEPTLGGLGISECGPIGPDVAGNREGIIDATAHEETRLALHAQIRDLGELLGRPATTALPVLAVAGARYP